MSARSSARLEVNNAEFNTALKKFQENSKRSVAANLKQQAKLLCVDAAKVTPPNKKFTWNRKGGEAAMRNDINKILIGLSPSLFEQFKDIFGGQSARRELRRKDGTVYVTDQDVAVSGNIAKFHKSQRTRNGRVTTAGQSGDRNIGRSKSYTRGVVTTGQKASYIRTAIQAVGKMAAGWKSAASTLGAKLPAWITRHSSAGFAKVHVLGNRVEVEIANQSVYSGQKTSVEYRVAAAMKKRYWAMIKRVDYFQKKAAENAGFATAGGS
jgi:hypothetical protein